MDNQNANIVLAGPSSGGAAAPAFRALVAPDIPIPSTLVPYGNGSGQLTTEAALAYIEGSDELRTGLLRLPEQGTPTTPASGFGLIFVGNSGVNNGVASAVDDAGVVYQMVRYATGTFTPAYAGSVTAGTTTYGANGQVGTYTRIGDRVDGQIYLSWTAATGTGNAIITGLPFTARNVTNLYGVPALLYNAITYAAGNGIQMLLRYNTTQIELYNAPASNTAVAAIAVEAAGELLLTFTYWI